MKRQHVVAHTVGHTEIPALLASWVTKRPSFKTLCPSNISSSDIFVKKKKNIIFLSVGLFRIVQVFSVSSKSYIDDL